MRTVNVTLTVKVVIKADDDVSVNKVINELTYEFADTTTQATVEDTEIIDFEITDSR